MVLGETSLPDPHSLWTSSPQCILLLLHCINCEVISLCWENCATYSRRLYMDIVKKNHPCCYRREKNWRGHAWNACQQMKTLFGSRSFEICNLVLVQGEAGWTSSMCWCCTGLLLRNAREKQVEATQSPSNSFWMQMHYEFLPVSRRAPKCRLAALVVWPQTSFVILEFLHCTASRYNMRCTDARSIHSPWRALCLVGLGYVSALGNRTIL